MALFGEVMEGLGSGASVKEVGHWEWALSRYNLVLFLLRSLLPECGYDVSIQPSASASMISMSAATSSRLEEPYPPGRQPGSQGFSVSKRLRLAFLNTARCITRALGTNRPSNLPEAKMDGASSLHGN